MCKECLDYKKAFVLVLGPPGMCYKQRCIVCTRVYGGQRYHKEKEVREIALGGEVLSTI